MAPKPEARIYLDGSCDSGDQRNDHRVGGALANGNDLQVSTFEFVLEIAATTKHR